MTWLRGLALGCLAIPIAGQTFEEHGTRFVIGANAVDILAVDLNDDGLPEILTADVGRMSDPREEAPAHSQLSYLLATGDLEYAPQPQLRTGFAPYCVVAANLDALKAPDLVVANFMASRNRDLTLIRNVGNNVFETTDFAVNDAELDYTKIRDGDNQPIYTAPGLTSVAVRDFDGDRFRDVIATGWSSDVLVYFPGAADTYLGGPRTIPAAGGPRDIEVLDMDGDGDDDLAVVLYSANALSLWKGDGDGGFIEVTRFASRGKLPQKLETADMNGDGRPDLIVSHRHADDSVVIFYGDGNFRFSMSQEIMLGDDREAVEYQILDIVVADVNLDGKPDIVAACHKARSVIVFLNTRADERLPVSFEQEVYSFEEARPNAVCVADFNADETPDIAVALDETHAVALLLGK